MKQQKFPPGWDVDRVERLLEHYESISEVEQVAEDEAADEFDGQTTMVVPSELVPAVRQLIGQKPSD